MTSQYNVTIDSLSDGFIDTLREHHPHASLEIRVKKYKDTVGLTEKKFWEIISSFDWSDAENDSAVIQPAAEILAGLLVRNIYEFQDILSRKLHALDTRAHAENTGENSWRDVNSDFSADEFLYARCCCIATGKEFYEIVLNEPVLMPKNLSFESLLRVAHEAYFKKTGKQFRYVPIFNIETFSNKKGWS